MRRRRAATGIAVVACAVFLAPGCGFRVAPPTPTPPQPRPVKVVDPAYVAVGSNRHAAELGHRRFLDTDTGLLVGPHFLLRQQSVGTVQEIDDPLARRLGLADAVKAPDGYEFVVADFAGTVGFDHMVPKGGHQPGRLPGGNVVKRVRVGKAYRPLQQSLDGGRLLVVAAKLKQRVLLRIDDAGRTQWLDLRTGERVHDSISRIYPRVDWSPPDSTDFLGWTGGGGLAAGGLAVTSALDEVGAELSPFTPSGRWAAPRHAWLYVGFQPRTYAAAGGNTRLRIDPRRDVRLRLAPGGRRLHGGGGVLWTTPVGSGATPVTVLAYQVPMRVHSALLTVAVDGRLEQVHGKTHKRLRWQYPPTPVVVPLRPHG